MKQMPQVVLCEGNHEVETLAPQRADEPFAQSIGLGTLWRRFQDAQTQVAYALIKLLPRKCCLGHGSGSDTYARPESLRAAAGASTALWDEPSH